jgi:hypothetical protein
MADSEILKVINPAAAERDRSALISTVNIPPHAEWRQRNPIGVALSEPQHMIQTNHFKVDVNAISGVIVHHHVHIYKVNRDGSIDKTEDAAVEGDQLHNVDLVLRVLSKHPEWQGNGWAYDGRSILYTRRKLNFTCENSDRQPYFEEDVGLKTIDGK